MGFFTLGGDFFCGEVEKNDALPLFGELFTCIYARKVVPLQRHLENDFPIKPHEQLKYKHNEKHFN